MPQVGGRIGAAMRTGRSGASAVILGATAWLALAGVAWAQAPETPVPEAGAPVIGAAALPRDLSPWGMFMSADKVVKGVLILLAAASVVTWTIWLAKTVEIALAKRRARAALRRLAAATSLADVGAV